MALDTVRPNVIRVHWSGQLTIEDLDLIRDYTSELRAEIGDDTPIFAFIELGEGLGIPKSVRKALMNLGREQPFCRTAVVGAPFQAKVMLELIFNAIRLLVKDAAETRFVDTVDEALDWLDHEQALAS